MVPYCDDNVGDEQQSHRYALGVVAVLAAPFFGDLQTLIMCAGLYALGTAFVHWDPVYALVSSVAAHMPKDLHLPKHWHFPLWH